MINIIIYICYGLCLGWVVLLLVEAFRQMVLKGKTFSEFDKYITEKYK